MSVSVGVVRAEKAEYPSISPFHPAVRFPEYPFGDDISSEPNFVYTAFRELLAEMGYDKENFGTSKWNPFGFLVSPGMTVVLNPNFVLSRHYEQKEVFSIITHASVLRAVADFVWIALQGSGKIIIADAPQYNCNWSQLLEITGLEAVRDYYNAKRAGSFELRDLRNYWSAGKHFPSLTQNLPGDPQGTLKVNLGNESAIKQIADPSRLYGAVYHRQETIANHTDDNQNYDLSNTIMQADVVIAVPKLKVHKKVGVTMNIKGLVGINTNKNMLVHYSVGSPKAGGDQYPENHFTPMEESIIGIERWMYDTFLAKRKPFLEYVHRSIYLLHGKTLKPLGIGVEKEKRVVDAGNWHGNDSAWRMSVDLLKIFMFVDKNGVLQKTPQRRIFSVIDGIIGGDGKGPLDPDPVYSGVLLAGENLLATDIVGTRLMGFDPDKVKMFTHLLGEHSWNYGIQSLKDIEVRSAESDLENCLSDVNSKFFAFRPHPGWIGKLEI